MHKIHPAISCLLRLRSYSQSYCAALAVKCSRIQICFEVCARMHLCALWYVQAVFSAMPLSHAGHVYALGLLSTSPTFFPALNCKCEELSLKKMRQILTSLSAIS